MTWDAPEINTIFEGTFGTLNEMDHVWFLLSDRKLMWGKKRMGSVVVADSNEEGEEEGGSVLIHANARHFALQGRNRTEKAAKALFVS